MGKPPIAGRSALTAAVGFGVLRHFAECTPAEPPRGQAGKRHALVTKVIS